MSILPRLESLPVEVRSTTRAVVWKKELRDGLWTKVPYQAERPHVLASVDNPATWATFDHAYNAVFDAKADGVGIVLGNGLVGIDLDQCRNPETGEIHPDRLELIRALDSYTEISPSETGVHVLVHGGLPTGRRRVKGIEMYADARYFTITGAHLDGTPTDIRERTTELEAVHARVFGSHPPPSPPRPTGTVPLTDAELLIKASRSSNGARFASLWSGDVSGYGDDDSAADLALCNLLAFWTGRDPARMDRLFRQSALMREKWDSRRRDTTYGALTIDRAIADCRDSYEPAVDIQIDDDDDDVDQDAADADATPESKPADWPILKPAALIGPFGDLVRAIGPQTEADPVALLAHALVAWGNLIGRTPRVYVGADEHHVNENVLIVGDTSTGRKGMAWSQIQAVMSLVDPDWAATRLLTGLSSGEGLIFHVRDPHNDDDGVADKRLAAVETEFAKTLRVARREGNTLSAVLRQAWDSGTLRVLTKNSPIAATGAHISIVGHITPLELRREVKSTDMASGFINRFLVVLVRRSQCLPDGGSVDPLVVETLVQRLTAATSFARACSALTRDADARDQWAAIYPQITRTRSGLVGAICNRAPAHVLRLACLYALADRSTVIRVAHQQAALALWTYAETSATKIFGLRTGHRLADYLLALVRQSPKGLTRTDICNALGRNRPKDEISEALQLLADYGLAYSMKFTETGGRPTMRWFASAETT